MYLIVKNWLAKDLLSIHPLDNLFVKHTFAPKAAYFITTSTQVGPLCPDPVSGIE
jgi:hypothetical protein